MEFDTKSCGNSVFVFCLRAWFQKPPVKRLMEKNAASRVSRRRRRLLRPLKSLPQRLLLQRLLLQQPLARLPQRFPETAIQKKRFLKPGIQKTRFPETAIQKKRFLKPGILTENENTVSTTSGVEFHGLNKESCGNRAFRLFFLKAWFQKPPFQKRGFQKPPF